MVRGARASVRRDEPPSSLSPLAGRGTRRRRSVRPGGTEEAADEVALAAMDRRARDRVPIATAVGRVTGLDVGHVLVRRGGVPGGAAGAASREGVRLGPGADAHVLAHELAHVALGHGDGEHRFVRTERPQIGSLDDVVADASRIANAHGAAGFMRWGRFTAASGGLAALEVLEGAASAERSSNNQMRVRYLYTTRCGLVDMRHFYQLMYIALLEGNEEAVRQGREHELTAEASSRFAPEDTTSNALGALFGSRQSWVQRVGTFTSNLRTFLDRCNPADWAAMTPAEQDTVVDFYAARDGAGRPLHANETANPRPPVPSTRAARPNRGIHPFVMASTGSTEVGWALNAYTGIVDE